MYTPTNGGVQQLTYVNEPNLYRVIFRSNKEQAKQFQDWVFNEVLTSLKLLTSIRKLLLKPPMPHLSNIFSKKVLTSIYTPTIMAVF